MRKKSETLQLILKNIKYAMDNTPFYKEKFKDVNFEEIKTWEDFEKLPTTGKEDLREAYPLGLSAVPNKDIVRIHSSSGTTGTPVIIPYTKKDVADWAEMFARCYQIAGCTEEDRVQITPGYGLWTAGIGFQAGIERLGGMAIPMGPGNTDKQIQMMIDLQSTVICATSSYALLLAEEIKKRGVIEKINLKRGVIGSERWGEKMRKRIASELGVKLYDIYGLTEIYGPGVAISCDHECGMHYFDDFFYCEIINPETGEIVPEGEVGELVITTLQKEGAPLVRYRTHDLTRFMQGECPCGEKYPRIDTLIGRSDDMVKVKGVMIFPQKVDELLAKVAGVSSEYQVMIDHLSGRDIVTVYFETEAENKKAIEREVQGKFKEVVGLSVVAKAVDIGELPRSEKKSVRIFDNRY